MSNHTCEHYPADVKELNMKTATKERPILFSGPMVKAILDGRKTVTRRVVKPQPPDGIDALHGNDLRGRAPYPLEDYETGNVVGFGFEDHNEVFYKCPYQVGMNLWVRETWRKTFDVDNSDVMEYRAGGTRLIFGNSIRHGEHRATSVAPVWRPSIFMPRWASRITLEIVSVRVERVQEITEADAQAEGVESVSIADVPRQAAWSCRQDFAQLWDKLNAKRGHSWESNPWVWRVEFRRLPCP